MRCDVKVARFPIRHSRCNPKLGSKTYGILPGRGMGYGLLRTYGLWGAIPHPPSRAAHRTRLRRLDGTFRRVLYPSPFQVRDEI